MLCICVSLLERCAKGSKVGKDRNTESPQLFDRLMSSRDQHARRIHRPCGLRIVIGIADQQHRCIRMALTPILCQGNLRSRVNIIQSQNLLKAVQDLKLPKLRKKHLSFGRRQDHLLDPLRIEKSNRLPNVLKQSRIPNEIQISLHPQRR